MITILLATIAGLITASILSIYIGKRYGTAIGNGCGAIMSWIVVICGMMAAFNSLTNSMIH